MRKAIVMAGGRGSRLRPLTLTRPKPLVPVANRPVMAHILEWLRDHGFSEVLVTLHYRAADVCRAIGDGRSFGLKITYQVEEEPVGTAGSVKLAESWIANEPFLVASGDALTDVNLIRFIQRHRETGAWLTLGLKHVQDPSQYGVVELDGRGRVLRFQEKPGIGRAFSHLANTGIYCVEPEVLERVPRGQACDWSRDVFPQLLAEGLPLFGHAATGITHLQRVPGATSGASMTSAAASGTRRRTGCAWCCRASRSALNSGSGRTLTSSPAPSWKGLS